MSDVHSPLPEFFRLLQRAAASDGRREGSEQHRHAMIDLICFVREYDVHLLRELEVPSGLPDAAIQRIIQRFEQGG